MRAGRSLDALLSAYRIGARLAWERFVAAGEAAGHEPRTLYRLASAIFDYIDGISAESVEGFTAGARGGRGRAPAPAPRARAPAGPRRRRRRGGPRPRAPGGLGAPGHPGRARGRRRHRATSPTPTASPRGWAAASIAAAEGALAIAWVPDPQAPGRRAQLESALDGVPAALGPTVVLERAPLSLVRARAAHALVLDGRVDGGALVVADEHLPALLLHAGDGALATDLAARALAPLDDLRPGARGRLRTTLRAWLDHPGQVTRVAGELHVHPQTVRYRVAQLRELFGERLEDADARFELALALRAEPPAIEVVRVALAALRGANSIIEGGVEPLPLTRRSRRDRRPGRPNPMRRSRCGGRHGLARRPTVRGSAPTSPRVSSSQTSRAAPRGRARASP